MLLSFISTLIVLCSIGLIGIFLHESNILLLLMSIEIILLGLNCTWIFFGYFMDDIVGQIMPLFILTVAAAEAAVFLALIVVYYRIRGVIYAESMNLLQG
uniref:NADH dehydrogenase subunit 4L n=1 Tax=Rhodella violacea TaxID=2801 RepID=UPI001FCCF95F|nr:NADH dehydrogenase subunit 4L [Rhodella violacea]UNJ19096.1 NADH dehydrogenase subunit 4L [Rhodella violacea]